MTADPRPALLELRGIVKRFAGVTALAGVDLTLRRGEVHALVGENGAGKSTLIKILTGAVQPDSGEIVLDGRTLERLNPASAKALGIAAIVAAALRGRIREVHGEWLDGDPGWYAFVSEHILRHGADRSPAEVLTAFLGHPLDARALLEDLAT